jgi:predicted metalloprotease
MRWQDMRRSDNVEDRRGIGGRGILLGGGGIGTLIIVLIIYLLGGNPAQLLNQTGAPSGNTQVELSPEEKELGEMVRAVLGDTEDVWQDVFQRQLGQQYADPKLVLFTQSTQSGCGFASAATGPFYCPADQKVYIDLGFYRELRQRFKAPGDFAQAYVIAHEVGHHVQNLLGVSDQVHQARSRLSETEFNQLSVRLELQADFYAGVWAHHSQRHKNTLEPGDIEEAIRAASAIGDDNIQKQSQGYVVPDSFTHGTGAQRVKWFRKGYESGDIKQGDTFSARDL